MSRTKKLHHSKKRAWGERKMSPYTKDKGGYVGKEKLVSHENSANHGRMPRRKSQNMKDVIAAANRSKKKGVRQKVQKQIKKELEVD